MKNLLESKWVVVLLLGLMAFSLVGSAALTFGQDDDLEDAPEESITLCGTRATVGFFARG